MKKSILVLLSLLTFSTLGIAQQKTGKWQIGVVGGPTQTYFKRQNNTFQHLTFEKDYRGAAGVSVSYHFSKLFLRTDFLYENKGFKTDLSTYNSNGEETWNGSLNFNHHYGTLPMLVGFSFGQTGLYANAGPYAAALLRETYSYDGPKAHRPTHDNPDTQTFKKLDFGFSGGIGYARAIGTHLLLSAEARHNEGLRNVSQGPIGFKSRSTALLVGVHYILGDK